jgi:mRNA interferase MazF
LMKKEIKRGDIYIANLDPALGSEEGKKRRVLIISNDIGNQFGTVVIAVPIMEPNPKRLRMPQYVPISPSKQNGQTKFAVIDCGQIRVLSVPHRLGNYIGTAEKHIMDKVDAALETSLALRRCPKCDYVLLPNKKHCVNCKHVLVFVCPRCIAEIDSSYKYCPHCGLSGGESK